MKILKDFKNGEEKIVEKIIMFTFVNQSNSGF
jgi:flagellar hook protein FlgE